MRIVFLAIFIASVTLLSGCATSAIVQSEYRLVQGEKFKFELNTPPDASEEGVTILRERLISRLSTSDLLSTESDASSRSRILEVNVTNYRMRHGAARAMVGIMAGADNILSTVRIKDQTTGEVLSKFIVESKNSTAWGTSSGMIEDHADKIVETLKGMQR